MSFRIPSYQMSTPRDYVELARPANVATAVADVLAGYAIGGLAHPSALPWLLVSTMCLYAGGVILNDFFDRAVDAVERPERPIPSGRVSPEAAARAGAGLLVAGVLSAALATRTAGVIAAATAGCVFLYDRWGKRQGLIGPVNMGMCRGLNLLLGVAAVPSALTSSWYLALLPLVYIAGVTALSRGEVHGSRHEVAAFALISLSLVVTALAVLPLVGAMGNRERGSGVGLLWTIVLGWLVLPAFRVAYRRPAPDSIRHAIRTGVLSLVFLDAALGAYYAGASYSLVILATGLLARQLARLFPVT
jgi:hypothetical protein